MKKTRRTLAIVCTLLFTICVFSFTAFAASLSSSSSLPSTSKSEDSAAPEPNGGGSSKVSSSASSKVSATISSKASSSKASAVSSKKPASVNTQQSKVNQAASRAAAVSDPDVLSSQNWNELLSSAASGTAAGAVSAVSSAVSSTPSGNGGGISWLLVVGILLILLGVAGIGFFIYLQFFSGPKNGRGGPSTGRPSAGKNEGSAEFTDISSSSDGIQHREIDTDGETISFDNIRPAGTIARAPAAPKPAPVQTPPQAAARPAVPSHGLEPAPRAQAEPVQNSKDFDWEKFFEENK